MATLQLSLVQNTPSLQETALPAQVFAAQTSPVVQALLSSQLAALAVLTHPVSRLQESLVQGLPSLQLSAPAPVHAPPAHTSPVVQALASLQGRALNLSEQPNFTSQLSSVQTLPSLQEIATPAQLPAAHLSPLVQALPSSHTLALLLLMQLPVATSQLSVVQGLLSLQPFAAPGTQPLALQTSPTVHELPSVQGLALATWVHPVSAAQASSVQTLPSLQLTSGPGKQTPAAHASPTEQTLLSALHGAPGFCAKYAQTPVAGAQVFLVQMPSPLGSQVTMLAGLTLHLYGNALLSQISVPLQKLPSSWLAQSLSIAQPQVFAPLAHLPNEQASPTVQPLPSSHTALLLT